MRDEHDRELPPERPEAAPPDDVLEPAIDADAGERLVEEHPDAPHPASRFDAGTGQGTVSGPPAGTAFQERPVLDGSTQSAEAEATVPNPHRGQTDPALMRDQPALTTTATRRWFYSGVVAFVFVGIVLLVLSRWDPLWCGIGLVVGFLGLVGMLLVRASRIQRPARLRLDALMLAVIWIPPLVIILSVMIGRSGEIWG